MTNREFRELVKRMRDAQKAYFRRRNPDLLDVARLVEREVDRELEDHGQGTFFGEGGGVRCE